MPDNRLTRIVSGITLTTLAITCSQAQAQLYHIPFKIPDDPAINPINLGLDFGADGDRVYVAGRGLSFGDDMSSGGVYQINRITYEHVQTINPVDHPWDDFYGWAMEYYDGALFVSAPYAQAPNGNDHGAVYLTNPFTGSVIHTFQETTTDTLFGFFGASLSVDDVNIFIGATRYGPTQQGSVFVYDSANNILVETLNADPATPDIRFGDSVDHNSSYIVVSAPGYDIDNIEGAVYVYDFNTGALLYRLTSPIPDTNGKANFGNEILLAGNKLLVSVGDFAPFNIRGRVYVYDLTTGNHIDTLLPETGDIFSRFGYSMSAEGNLAVISCERDNDVVINGGAVYLYDLTTLEMIEKIRTPMLNRNFMQFGEKVKIQDGTIFASASDPRESDIQTNKEVIYILEPFCRADINLDGSVDFFDVSAFIKFAVDFNGDGIFDFFDVSSFIQSYQEECP